MNCTQCKTLNPIGNRFCRECGTRLPEPSLLAREEAEQVEEERRQERGETLRAEAFALSEKGQIEAAIPLAEEAASLLPHSTAAQALLVGLYERSHQNEKAIAAMERVVALNPESSVDRDKLERLQRGVHLTSRRTAASSEPEHDPIAFWAPRLGAALAGVLVVGIGARLMAQKPEPPVKKPPLRVREGAALANPGAPVAANAAPPPVYVPPPVAADPFRDQGYRSATPAPEPIRRSVRHTGSARPRSLPRAGTSAAPPTSAPSIPPVSVSVPAHPVPDGSGLGGIQSRPPGEGSERISVGPPASSGQGQDNGPGGDGFIRIQTDPPARAERSEKREEKGSGDEDPALRAQSLQGVGRYRDALALYRELLGSGVRRGDLLQNVALCHQRLGEPAAARDAYSQAIGAYQSQLRMGQNAPAAERGIAACQAALELLRG